MNKFFACLVFVILFSPLVLGLGITPARNTINFESELSESFSLSVVNSENKNIDLVAYVKGDLAPYVSLEENEFSLSQGQASKTLNYQVRLPADMNPGLNTADIVVLEVPNQESASGPYIGAVLAVTTQIHVNVPYPGKYAEADLNIIDAEQGDDVTFIIPVINRGKLDLVDVKANIDIYNSFNEKIDSFVTQSIPINSGQRREIVSKWNANVSVGTYKAVMTLIYDESSLQIEKTFNVGAKILELKNITVNDFSLGGIAQFDMLVENKWNGSVNDVYTQTKVYNDDGDEMANFKSPTYDFTPFQQNLMTSYWDTAGVNEGVYDASVFLKYNEKSTQKDFRFEVSENEINIVGLGYVISERGSFFEENKLVIILGIIASILVVLNLAWFVFFRRKLKK